MKKSQATTATVSVFFLLGFALSAFAAAPTENHYVITDGKGTCVETYSEKFVPGNKEIKVEYQRNIFAPHAKTETIAGWAQSDTLAPLRYNYQSKEGNTQVSIDGSLIENGKVFLIKHRINGKKQKDLRAEFEPGLFLSIYFPVWIKKQFEKGLTGTKQFQYIFEDQVVGNVPVYKGDIFPVAPDDYAKKTKTKKIRVTLQAQNVVNFIWINDQATIVRLEVPSGSDVETGAQRIVERVESKGEKEQQCKAKLGLPTPSK